MRIECAQMKKIIRKGLQEVDIMSFLVPRRQHGTVANSFFDDSFFTPFFDMKDMFGSAGFRVDVKDKKDHYELDAELPGVPKDQIDIGIENGVLTISADMNSEKSEEREHYVYSERRVGKFQRSFQLDGVEEEGIKAAYENGVLKLMLPKKKTQMEDRKRRIDIES